MVILYIWSRDKTQVKTILRS